MSKILFICEGEKTEKKFCNLIIEKYFIQRKKDKEYVAFRTNIYGLYDEMAKDPGLDIVSLMVERAKVQKDMYNYNLYLNNFSQEKLLDIQQELLKNNNVIQVINTSVFWGMDFL